MSINFLKTVTAMAAAMILVSTAARADFCNDQVTDKVNQVMAEQYDAKTVEIDNALAALEKAGMTNSQLYVQLVEMKKKVYDAFVQAGQNAAAQGIDDCRAGLQPYQEVMDLTVAYFTNGLSLVLPERMTHIDVGEILSGNILGGERSLPNEILRGLGIKF